MNEFDDLLDQVSPKYYQEFRRLYNELLGYMERDELDKIKAFSARIDQTLHRALHIQMAIDRRLMNFNRQKNIVQKELFHERFRNPKSTIQITHPFPLKYPVKKQVELSPEPVVSTLDTDRKVDALMTDMANYNQSKAVEDYPPVPIDEPNVAQSLDKDIQGDASTQWQGKVPLSSNDGDDGVSLSDEFVDSSLYIKGEASEDLRRSEGESTVSDSPKTAPEPSKETNVSSDKSRRERIWDYIDEDKKSGGISHDL